MSIYCYPLAEATDVARYGGKAANLARVEQCGYRVPATMVLERRALADTVAAVAVQKVLDRYLVHACDADHTRANSAYALATDALSSVVLPPSLRDEILTCAEHLLRASPYGVAVRSSSVYEDSKSASFAGVFESFVGVMDPEAVLEKVIACWCSGISPVALRYMQKMGIRPDTTAMAVLIQSTVSAEASGAIYTADPVSGDPWQFVLQATRGLALDLMSGSGVGDQWHLDWQTGACLRCAIADKPTTIRATPNGIQTAAGGPEPALTETEIRIIARIARELDEHFGARLDIEWAQDESGLWVVQARPMTALPEFFPADLPAGAREKTWRPALVVVPLRSDRPPHFLTPLYAHYSESEMWYRYQPDDIVLYGIWTSAIDVNGYRYCDPGERPDFESPHRYCDPSAQPHFRHYFKGPEAYEEWLAVGEGPYRSRWNLRHKELSNLREQARFGLAETQSTVELIPVMLDCMDRLWDLVAFGWSGPQALGAMCDEALRCFLQQHDIDADMTDLLCGGTGSFTFRVAKGQQDLGRSIFEPSVDEAFERLPVAAIVPYLLSHRTGMTFLDALEAFCWRSGKIPPSWIGRPSFWSAGANDVELISAIKRVRLGGSHEVEALATASTRRRQCAEEEVRARVPRGDHERLTRLLDWARYWGQALNDRHELAAGALWEREVIWQVGQRACAEEILADAADILLLTRDDLERFVKSGDTRRLRQVLDLGRRAYLRHKRLAAPKWIGTPPTVNVAAPANQSTGLDESVTTYTGHGFGGGTVTGRARIVTRLDPGLLETLTHEDVFILPHEQAFVRADWHSLMMVIKGVVSPGQPSHHLAQVARECGVPLVGHVKGDLSRIAEGATVQVDGTLGIMHVQQVIERNLPQEKAR